MSKAFAYDLWVFLSYEEQRRAIVTEVVQTNPWQLGGYQYRTEIAVVKVRN